MSKPKAQVRKAKHVPQEYRDPTRDYQKEAETLMWTDENGRPISRVDLINYDTSDRTVFEPSNIQSSPQSDYYDLSFLNDEKRKQKAQETIQNNKAVVSSVLDFVPIVGDIKGGYEGILQPLQQGNYLTAGLGIGMLFLPNFIEKPLKWVGKGAKYIFHHLPYKQMNQVDNFIRNAKKDAKIFFSTDISKNPIKAVKFNRLLRNKRRNPTVNVEDVQLPQGTIVNSQEDALKLTQSRTEGLGSTYRDNSGRIALEGNPTLERLEQAQYIDYLPILDAYKHMRRQGYSKLGSLINTPRTYIKGNTIPAAYAIDGPIIYNKKALKDYGWDSRLDVALAHELNHHLDEFSYLESVDDFFTSSHLPYDVKYYIESPQEILARGNQIKNYFGLSKADDVVTGDMLKYAAKHYVDDTGMDNNMTQFFSGITDWDKMADFITKYSYKTGGKLNQNKQ